MILYQPHFHIGRCYTLQEVDPENPNKSLYSGKALFIYGVHHSLEEKCANFPLTAQLPT